MQNLLLVILGGGIGSGLRYGVGQIVAKKFPDFNTLGTLSVNIIGSFLIGVLIAVLLKQGDSQNKLHLLLVTGFCGGFTTFSAFAYENYTLLKSGEYSAIILYILGSLIFGIAAVFLGLFIGIKF